VLGPEGRSVIVCVPKGAAMSERSERADERLDALMASMSPVSEAQVDGLPISRSERDLLEGIMSGTTAEPIEPDGGEPSPEPPLILEPAARRARRRPHRQLIGAIGAAAVIAVVVAAFASRQPRSDPSVQADDPSVQAEDAAPGALPHLVVDLPGWHMDSIESYDETEGSMTFVDSGPGEQRWIMVKWAPASEPQSVNPGDEVLATRQVTGADAVVSRTTYVGEDPPWGDDGDPYQAAWRLDGFSLTAMGIVEREDEFVEVLAAIRKVELDVWTDALPPTVIWSGDQAVIDAMLVDVPLPPGFDSSGLLDARLQTREEVRGLVAQAVACGWVESWIAATDAGDAAGVQRAVDVMAGSGDWAIVKEADPEADQLNGQLRQLRYDEIRTIAEAMPTDAVIPLDGGPGMKVRELYANWLECHH